MFYIIGLGLLTIYVFYSMHSVKLRSVNKPEVAKLRLGWCFIPCDLEFRTF